LAKFAVGDRICCSGEVYLVRAVLRGPRPRYALDWLRSDGSLIHSFLPTTIHEPAWTLHDPTADPNVGD
jgi:hypothetical protein